MQHKPHNLKPQKNSVYTDDNLIAYTGHYFYYMKNVQVVFRSTSEGIAFWKIAGHRFTYWDKTEINIEHEQPAANHTLAKFFYRHYDGLRSLIYTFSFYRQDLLKVAELF